MVERFSSPSQKDAKGISKWIPQVEEWFSPLVSGPGLRAVFRKELADHFNSRRFLILATIVAVTGLAAIYVAAVNIRQEVRETAESGFVFLRLFTASGGSLPPFTSFMGFLGPLVGLALGFDAINGERVRGTLSRLVAQPIHRDSIINGKFLASICIIALMIFALGFIVAGLGLRLIGIPPTGEEVLRILAYLGLSVVYVAFWLALSLLFSVVFRQTATSALAAIATWLFVVIFVGLLAGLIADAVVPVGSDAGAEELLRHERLHQALGRLSPTILYDEATTVLLQPQVRTLGPVLLSQIEWAVPGPLPFGQSLLLIWPHLTGLVAATLVCFAASYVLFMRHEIRAS